MRLVQGFTAPFYSIVSPLSKSQAKSHVEHRLNSSAQPPALSMPTIEISWGELIDKITILEIKEQRLTAPAAVANVRKELMALSRAVGELKSAPGALGALKQELKSINSALWDIENRTRAKEAAKTFDQEFIELTRSVYLNKDKRARIKRQINELLNSGLVEEKQYTPYAT